MSCACLSNSCLKDKIASSVYSFQIALCPQRFFVGHHSCYSSLVEYCWRRLAMESLCKQFSVMKMIWNNQELDSPISSSESEWLSLFIIYRRQVSTVQYSTFVWWQPKRSFFYPRTSNLVRNLIVDDSLSLSLSLVRYALGDERADADITTGHVQQQSRTE